MLPSKNLILIITFLLASLINLPVHAEFTPIKDFGENPGEISASYFSPIANTKNLVVLLHGCVQNGEQLAKQSGFQALAKQHNFTLLLPQQTKSNNIKSCFNWFSEQDINRDQGETLSLKNIILRVKEKVNAQHIYIAGISAGGAMASSLLTNYPNMFSAGAIVAGIPTPCANNLIKAISCMRSGPSQTISELTDFVQQKNTKQMHWPRLSIWAGKKDTIVHPLNAQRLAQQWVSLNALNRPPEVLIKQDYKISQWKNSQQQTAIELIEINNMSHGIAVNPNVKNGGEEAPFLLKSSLSAAIHIIDFWKIGV